MVRMIGNDDTGKAGHAVRALQKRDTSIECTVTVMPVMPSVENFHDLITLKVRQRFPIQLKTVFFLKLCVQLVQSSFASFLNRH